MSKTSKLTTCLDGLLDSDDVEQSSFTSPSYDKMAEEIDTEQLPEIILDLSQEEELRLCCMEKYFGIVGNDTMYIISSLASMYHMSGSKTIERFFCRVTESSVLTSVLKYECARNILDFEEDFESGSAYERKEVRKLRLLRNEQIAKSNAARKEIGYSVMNAICVKFEGMSAPCRLDAICKLMSENSGYEREATQYFCNFVLDSSINCEYRYKSILSLENRTADLFRRDITRMFDQDGFVEDVYSVLETELEQMYPDTTFSPTNRKMWNDVLFHLRYEELRKVYRMKFPDRRCGFESFIQSAQMAFLLCKENDVYYRILAGQYLLQKCELQKEENLLVCKEIETIASCEEVEYNRRADASDVLLRLGVTEEIKEIGRRIISQLASLRGEAVNSIFDNAQNVHVEKVEESVSDILEFLSGIQLQKVGEKLVDFNYVNTQVENMLREQREKLYKPAVQTSEQNSEQNICAHCNSIVCEVIQHEDKKFCSAECLKLYERDVKIRLAMNRVCMDRAIYSKFNSSLVNILLRVWSYIVSKTHEHEEEMKKRLLEELEEMSQTCSSGFATRLVNVISGFGEVNIRISWEDQIRANLSGRLNAKIRDICNEDSIFRRERLNDVIELWLRQDEAKEMLSEIEELFPVYRWSLDSTTQEKLEKRKEAICTFLREQGKIDTILEDFSSEVLVQLTMASGGYEHRKHFLLFFRTVLPEIREELYKEFKSVISDEDFDLFMRKSILHYEGEKY
jgi:hypothetical protein